MRWDIITGEFPPQAGGVSDYTWQIAQGLGAAGDEVHVWAPACEGLAEAQPGVIVHRLGGRFGPRTLSALSHDLATPLRRCILVQYVPQAFGYKGANLPFCLWLWSRRRDTIWTMFHEVSVPFDRRRRLRWNVLAVVTLTMAAVVARASTRIYISIPAWETRLRPLTDRRPEWLPVPSNIPASAPIENIAAARAKLKLPTGSIVIGHFSSYSTLISPLLLRWVAALLPEDSRRIVVLIGFRVGGYADDVVREHPGLAGRLRIADGLAPDEVAAHLAACDLMIQPYPDGASTRRTTLMAGIALGLPVITNTGSSTEPLWLESGAAAMVDGANAGEVQDAAEALLGDPERRAELGRRAAALYRERFTADRVIAKLRGDANGTG